MTSLADKLAKMTVEEYLLWVAEQPEMLRYELIDGTPVAMSPERARHAITKGEMYVALRSAVKAAGLDCTVFPDGMTVIIDDHTAYEPDVVVTCGQEIQGDDVVAPNPVIVVEVLSPSTGYVDLGTKLAGYFQIKSVRHYLILDPVKKVVTHHERGADGVITTHILQGSTITLTPPGIDVGLVEIFATTIG